MFYFGSMVARVYSMHSITIFYLLLMIRQKREKYYWLILSDMPFEIAEPEIMRQRDIIIDHLNRSYLKKTENDDIPLYVMRNALARLPEYAYIKNRQPYVDEESGRWRLNMGIDGD